jgi:ATP-binding cassette, subfamily B, bacterial
MKFIKKLYAYHGWMCLAILAAGLSGLYGTCSAWLGQSIINHLSTSTFYTTQWMVLWFLNSECHNACWRALEYARLQGAPCLQKILLKQYVHVFQRHANALPGAVTNALVVYMQQQDAIWYQYLPMFTRNAVQLITALYAIFCVNIWLCGILFIWLIFFISSSAWCATRIRYVSHAYTAQQSQWAGNLAREWSERMTTRLLGVAQQQHHKILNAFESVQHAFQTREWFLIKFYTFQGIASTMVMVVCIGWLSKLYQKNLATIGDFALLFGLGRSMIRTVWESTKTLDQWNIAIGQSRQAYQLLHSHQVAPLPSINHKPSAVMQWDNVSFAYTNSLPLFSKQSLCIHTQQKIWIQGVSGVGKTTFLKLCAGLCVPQEGSINIIPSFGCCIQGHLVRSGTILDNLCYGPYDVSQEAAIKAAQYTGLHALIEPLSHGYHTHVQTHTLSNGQQQLLALTRLYLYNPDCVLLDEPIIHFDTTLANVVTQWLYLWLRSKTVLMVSHQPIAWASHTIVLTRDIFTLQNT